MLQAPDLQFRSFVATVNKVASVVRSAAWAIMFPHRTAWPMILINSVSILVPAEVTFNSIRGALRNQAASAEEDRLRICKEKAYAVFMRIVEKTAPAAHPMENIA